MKKRRDNTELICSIGELAGLFTDTTGLENFLQKTVTMIAQHMHSSVCSIYLYDDSSQLLTLYATYGLNQKVIKNVQLRLGEGLTGLCLKELRPICEQQASKNLNFKYFSGLGEEKFESFLAVPINRGANRIGAMVIQNKEKDFFTDVDVNTLRAISIQLVNTIEMARLMMLLSTPKTLPVKKFNIEDLRFLKGRVGAVGYAYAKGAVFQDDKQWSQMFDDVEIKNFTLKEFHQALKVTEKQIDDLQKDVEEKLADVASLIFSAQILMLKDQAFISLIEEKIAQGINPPFAVASVVDDYADKFLKIEDDYIREKSLDIRDVGVRIVANLLGGQHKPGAVKNKIVIARELLPSDVLKFSSKNVQGIILLTGGTTSHVSILAQSLKIPLIIVSRGELLEMPGDIDILMDADQGNIYLNPNKDILKSFAEKEAAKRTKVSVKAKTLTKDGQLVQLYANINLLGDLQTARVFKAQGIGLYRSEFPFIIRNSFPSEEEQFVIYNKLVEGMPGKEITFRTLDIGGDKVLSYFEQHSKENNPFLGMRSIRFSLAHQDVFAQQLRAILRAGAQAPLRIMFPMISSVDEFVQARQLARDCIDQLMIEGKICQQQPLFGLMLELPSVIEIIDALAAEADFFSIGTNDFIQYMLAVDRTNEKIANLYKPYHPSILRSFKRIVQSVLLKTDDISVCGDMAQDLKYLAFFIGIGIRKFSINPSFIPRVQAKIETIELGEAQRFAQKALAASNFSEIERLFI